MWETFDIVSTYTLIKSFEIFIFYYPGSKKIFYYQGRLAAHGFKEKQSEYRWNFLIKILNMVKEGISVESQCCIDGTFTI